MEEIKFVKITGSGNNFVDLVNLARSGKNDSDSIIKVCKNVPANSMSIEIWRRAGGVDCFLHPHNDLFDRFSIKGDSVQTAPIGAISEQNLHLTDSYTMLLTTTIISEKSLPGVISKIAEAYGFSVTTEAVKENRNTIPEMTIEI